MTPNFNSTTGVRYGVIATNSLDPDLVDDLFYGPQATNVTEEEAYAEAKAEIKSEYLALVDEAKISATESGADREPNFDPELYQERWFEDKGYKYDDEESFIDIKLRNYFDGLQIEEPTITGTYEGVTYQIGELGGASMLWVIEGPEGNARSLCSPCVPNAADLDRGFVLDSEIEGGDAACAALGVSAADHENGFPCYCVPREWLAKELL